MKVFTTAREMQQHCRNIRASGRTIAFVPTMGFLHEGHLELMRVGLKKADQTAISIFVNPIQFGPGEDFEDYPRDTEGDLAKAEKLGVDLAFVPPVEEIYSQGFQTKVSVTGLTRFLCGASRPGHFDGVTTVVAKLFHITKPHYALFGQKDFQQLVVIKRMVKDLNMDLEIIGVPTYREADGLAMSSRNSYLNPEKRRSALCLKKSLDLAEKMVSQGEKEARNLIKAIRELISRHPYTEIDYVHLCDPITLEDSDILQGETLLALAVRVGKTRLIDNCLLGGTSNHPVSF
jgi:pantoate--beta-alanine ligase